MQNSILIYTDISQNVSNPYIVTPDDLKINDEFESNKKIISLLDKIELSSMNNKSFLSFFTYENSSLWWFMRPSIIMPLRTIINFIDRFEEVLDKQKPSEIKIQGDFSKFEIIKEICAKKNIKFSYSKIKYFSYQKKTSLKYKLQRERFKKIFFSKINKRIKVSQSRNNRNNLYDDSIIFAIPTGYRRSISLPNSTKTKGEFIQGNLISIMDELNEKTHCIDLDYTFQGEPDVLHERMAEGNWQPLEYFVTKKTNPNHTEFFKNYDNIIKNNPKIELSIPGAIKNKEVTPKYQR